jgi:hypothetical protein
MKKIILPLIFFAVSNISAAADICKTGFGITTPFGKLVSTRCTNKGIDKTHTLSLNDVKVLEDVHLFSEESNKDKSLHIYTSGDFDIGTGCSRRIYLVDLSLQPVKVIAFGVKNACNEFHWASWGDKRSVIALKNNVKFVYENGKLTPPPAGEKLFKAIEPPHSSRGADLTEDSAIPFVNEVALPK